MAEELAAQVATRAADNGISERTAYLLMTGSLPAGTGEATLDRGAVLERADKSGISAAAAALLMAPEAQSLGLLATAVKPIRQ